MADPAEMIKAARVDHGSDAEQRARPVPASSSTVERERTERSAAVRTAQMTSPLDGSRTAVAPPHVLRPEPGACAGAARTVISTPAATTREAATTHRRRASRRPGASREPSGAGGHSSVNTMASSPSRSVRTPISLPGRLMARPEQSDFVYRSRTMTPRGHLSSPLAASASRIARSPSPISSSCMARNPSRW